MAETKFKTSRRNVRKRIAVVTMGVKLGDELRGYTRFRKISEMLVSAGFEVDLITSTFQHWDKKHRDITRSCYRGLGYNIVFIDEPGYEKNLDLKRIRSHHVASKNIAHYFAANPWRYDLIYCEVPPNDVARACVEAAESSDIPFVADINDLWPEAMRMTFGTPVVSDAVYLPFTLDARKVYRKLTAAVGTSDEYAARPAKDRSGDYPHITVYVGNDLPDFDAGVARYGSQIKKPEGEIWVTYAGTLGASYDLNTLIDAAHIAKERCSEVRVKILGDGPDRKNFEDHARALDAPVDFLGYQDYAHMAAYLSVSDIMVNSLVKGAAQSIVTKIGDYLASGKPLINTGTSQEFRHKVSKDGFGVNVAPGDSEALAGAICRIARNASARKIMGAKARITAEKEFDQNCAYLEIVHLIQMLLV